MVSLTFGFPVVELVNNFLFIGGWKLQRTHQCLHELKAFHKFQRSPVVKVTVAPLISDFRTHVFCVTLNIDMKNWRITQNS